jgi:hypothetical protein
MTEPGNVLIIIKNPAKTGDFKTQVPLHTTSVLELKQLLEREYEGNPHSGDQRLVFAGKLLNDHSSLQELLAQVPT